MICERRPRLDIRQFGRNLPKRLIVDGQAIAIDRTPQHFGGVRYWFLCPGCGRRCAILYPRLCRLCMGLRYATETASPADRKLMRAFKIRHRLGQTSGGIVAPFPLRPVGMHARTWTRLRAAALQRELEIWQDTLARLKGRPG